MNHNEVIDPLQSDPLLPDPLMSGNPYLRESSTQVYPIKDADANPTIKQRLFNLV